MVSCEHLRGHKVAILIEMALDVGRDERAEWHYQQPLARASASAERASCEPRPMPS
jgi:hypothetical protein